MKQGGPLKRHKPWIPTEKTIQADRDWKAGRGKKKATRPQEMSERDAKTIVRARATDSYGVEHCEIALPGVCSDKPSDFSHRKARSQGGLWLPSHGLRACRWCHLAITDTNGHRADYEYYGWLVPRRLDPHDVEVLIRGQWVYLSDDGATTPATGEAA